MLEKYLTKQNSPALKISKPTINLLPEQFNFGYDVWWMRGQPRDQTKALLWTNDKGGIVVNLHLPK